MKARGLVTAILAGAAGPLVAVGLACAQVEPAPIQPEGLRPAPLTLARALELGRQRAPVLMAARAQARSAAAGIDELRAGYYPSVGIQVSASGATLRGTQPGPPPGGGRFT